MHICQFTFEYYPITAGIATVVEKLSDHLAGLGHRVTIVTPNFFARRSIDSPHEIVSFPPPPKNRVTPEWKREVHEILSGRLHGIDLIHAHNAFPCGSLALGWADDGRRVPVLVTSHGYDLVDLREYNYGYGPEYQAIIKEVLTRADYLTVPSQIMLPLIEKRGIDLGKLTVIPNGVDLPPARNTAEGDSPYLLFLGSLKPIKGVDRLLQVFSLIAQERKDLKLYIVGEGPEKEKLIKLSLKLKSGRRVIFKSPVRDEVKNRLLQECCLVMVPSHFESFGITALEAQAAGKPVVAFDVGGISENVVNRKTGILIPAGDINGMAAQTIKLLEDKERYRKYSNAARRRAEKFSWKIIAENYLEIYKSVASQ